MDERRIGVGPVTLAVVEAGAGGRPLLLVHGFCGAKEDFTDFVDRLAARGWHAVAPDLRGHGSSDGPATEDAYDLPAFAADVLALADALGWSRFTLLGHSMGGMVAQTIVLDHPDRVDALVLMDTCSGPPEGVDAELMALAAKVVRDDGLEAFLELEAAMAGPLDSQAHERVRRERPGFAEFCDRKARASIPPMRAAMYPRFPARVDVLDRLAAAVSVPTLVVVGDEDAAMLPSSHAMAAAIPDARLAVIARAGHSPQFENADSWWAAVSSFLDSLPTS